MAKRKRLTPANPLFSDTPGYETKAFSPTPPIAGVAAASSSAAALQDLADSIAEARATGRMVITVPLAQIDLDHLVRDRMGSGSEEMAVLKASLLARGQQTPVELTDLGGGRYGLISGWRRCTALMALHAETGEDRFASVLGLVRQPSDASEAYIAMVEENEIRAGLSYYERARIVARATERGVFPDTRSALRALFAAASRPRRSKIGSFLALVDSFDGQLRFPEAISERLGLALVKALEADPGLAPVLRARLKAASPDSAEAEQACLQAGLRAGAAAAPRPDRGPAQVPPALPRPADTVQLSQTGTGKVVLQGPGLTRDFIDALRAWLEPDKG